MLTKAMIRAKAASKMGILRWKLFIWFGLCFWFGLIFWFWILLKKKKKGFEEFVAQHITGKLTERPTFPTSTSSE